MEPIMSEPQSQNLVCGNESHTEKTQKETSAVKKETAAWSEHQQP